MDRCFLNGMVWIDCEIHTTIERSLIHESMFMSSNIRETRFKRDFLLHNDFASCNMRDIGYVETYSKRDAHHLCDFTHSFNIKSYFKNPIFKECQNYEHVLEEMESV